MNNLKKVEWLNIALLLFKENLVRPSGFISFTRNCCNRLYNPVTRQHKTEIARPIYFFFDNPLGLKKLVVHIDNIIVDDVIKYFKENPQAIDKLKEDPYCCDIVSFIEKELNND